MPNQRIAVITSGAMGIGAECSEQLSKQGLHVVIPDRYELKHVAGLRLLYIELPDEFAAAYPDPTFGIEGTQHCTSHSTQQ